MDKAQREMLLRLAKQDPTLRAKLIDTLKGNDKQASRGDYDAAAFAAWAKMTNPQGMSDNEVKAVLTSAGLTIKPPVPKELKKVKKSREPLSVGQVVRVDKHNCNAKENQSNCAKLHTSPENEVYYQIVKLNEPRDLRENCSFEISPIDPTSGRVSSKKFTFCCVLPQRGTKKLLDNLAKAETSGDVKAIEKAQEEIRTKTQFGGSTLGLYKAYRDLESYKKDKYIGFERPESFVAVYERGTSLPVPETRKEFNKATNKEQTKETIIFGEFDDLIESLEDYNAIYYQGVCTGGAHNKKDDTFYAKIKDEDRGWTNITPSKGKVLWIGKESDIPNNWKEDLRARLKAVVEEHLKQSL
jgi:hypothetical protein